MAVKDVLPKENLRAVDIRDTLIAHGADWSNVEGNKSANYLPNYFREEAKINKWSKRKPMISTNLYYTESGDDGRYGLKINRSSTNNISPILNQDFKYTLPSGDRGNPFRLSDFAGYAPNSKTPLKSYKVPTIIEAEYETLIVFDNNLADDGALKLRDIFAFEQGDKDVGLLIVNETTKGTGFYMPAERGLEHSRYTFTVQTDDLHVFAKNTDVLIIPIIVINGSGGDVDSNSILYPWPSSVENRVFVAYVRPKETKPIIVFKIYEDEGDWLSVKPFWNKIDTTVRINMVKEDANSYAFKSDRVYFDARLRARDPWTGQDVMPIIIENEKASVEDINTIIDKGDPLILSMSLGLDVPEQYSYEGDIFLKYRHVSGDFDSEYEYMGGYHVMYEHK